LSEQKTKFFEARLPFAHAITIQRVRQVADDWNSRNPEEVAVADTQDSTRRCSEFVNARQEIGTPLTSTSTKELEYPLIKRFASLLLGLLTMSSPTILLARQSGHKQMNLVANVAGVATTNFDRPAELPRVYLSTALANTPAPVKVTQVNAGGDFQAALNNASCGDTIELLAGATFSGVFKFPNKPCDDSHWIIVRTREKRTFSPIGSRIDVVEGPESERTVAICISAAA